MEETKYIFNCISCGRNENSVPLVAITFAQISSWICTQCLPTLIHNPNKLEDKFKNIDVINPPKPMNE